MLAPNTILQNRYRVVKPLGEGGMGAVYLARDERLGNSVALKETFCEDEELRRAFEHEARLLAGLRHASLPKVIDHFIEGQGQFLVMEFIPGEDLMQMLTRRGSAFPVDEVLEWADQLLGALEYLHSRQPPVIHRDIKPANIKLTDDGHIVLLDFGLAKGKASGMTRVVSSRSIAGYTPNFAPIEQVLRAKQEWLLMAQAFMKPEDLDRILTKETEASSDLYALAATLYSLLTNALPASSEHRLIATLRGLDDPLRPVNAINPAVDEQVAKVLAQAMAVDWEERPASAVEMRKALKDARRASDPAIIVLEPLSTFEFETVTLDTRGSIINRRKGQARCYIEDLGGGVTLEMVCIPSGTFMMGSPDDEAERLDSEGPQHRVRVLSFYIGKYPVTQAQWRAVASLPKVNRDLDIAPSHFKGNDRPVEQISSIDSIEFCARLSKRNGKTYRLPTEAEWEYACRAGTTTPFAFGETITSEIVNYDGHYAYKASPTGLYRVGTNNVGSLEVANKFGLYDMHGNVWEWCIDTWHDSYNEAPADGSEWESDDARRLLRGGSWNAASRSCRSAYRFKVSLGIPCYDFGFRVVLDMRTR